MDQPYREGEPLMPPCMKTFPAFKAGKPILVKATTQDQNAVFSLRVVVVSRAEKQIVETFDHGREDLENGLATWTLSPACSYLMVISTDRDVSLQTSIDVGANQIFASACSSGGPGRAANFNLATRKDEP